MKYSALNTARSALSSVIILPGNVKFGDYPLVTWFMKGVFNLHPPSPRYTSIWDPSDVLVTLKCKPWTPARKLSLIELSMKTAFLMLLTSLNRPQLLISLDLTNMEEKGSVISFCTPLLTSKQGRPGYKPELVSFKAYPDKRLCVVHYIKEYIAWTDSLRGNIKKFFITTKRPHKSISQDTASRWVKQILQCAGVDIASFGAGSTRAAASSKARRGGAPLAEIMRAAGWTRQDTFTKWYKKSVNKAVSVADAVLE